MTNIKNCSELEFDYQNKVVRVSKNNYVKYDPKSPSGLIYVKCQVKKFIGKPAINLKSSDGYYRLSGFNKKTFPCSHIVWLLFNEGGVIEKHEQIDHVDGNLDNNKIENLRKVTQEINNRNKGKYKTNKSDITGVKFMYNKVSGQSYWVASWHPSPSKRKSSYFNVKNMEKGRLLDLL